MPNHYLIEDSARTLKVLLLALIAIVIITGAGVCWFIDSRPTTIVQNHTNLYIQKADIWILKDGEWGLDTKKEGIELKDMP